MLTYTISSERGSVIVKDEDGEYLRYFALLELGSTIEVYDMEDCDAPPVWIVETVFDALEKIMDVDPKKFQ
jgi:hypothetical protein